MDWEITERRSLGETNRCWSIGTRSIWDAYLKGQVETLIRRKPTETDGLKHYDDGSVESWYWVTSERIKTGFRILKNANINNNYKNRQVLGGADDIKE